MKVPDYIHDVEGAVVICEMVDMNHVDTPYSDLVPTPPCDDHYSNDPTHPQNQQDDEVYRASMDEAIIEKGLYWIVLVLQVVGIADKEVNTHEGVVMYIWKGHKVVKPNTQNGG